MKRREFIKGVILAAGGLFLSGCAATFRPETDGVMKTGKQTGLPRRTLGRTGIKLSIIGMGGIAVRDETPERAAQLVRESIEAGVNYFDVAPSYGDAELKLGPALKPWRERVFLAGKTTCRDARGAWAELESSLARLQTDRVDLYQMHALTTEEEVETALGKGGALEAFLRAKREGLARHLGFSAHSPQAALKAMREFDFETVLYPVNFASHFRSGFESEVLAEAGKRGLGILALKALAQQAWPKGADRKQHPKCWYEPVTEPELAELALYWTLSQGVTAALPPGDEPVYRMALALGAGYRELTEAETEKLKRLAADLKPVF